jgi:hypothetical protein
MERAETRADLVIEERILLEPALPPRLASELDDGARRGRAHDESM